MGLKRKKDINSPIRSSNIFNVWLTNHVSASIGSLGQLSRQPFASLMIILVIGVTLALPSAINILIKNMQSVSNNWGDATNFSVYLKKDLSIKNDKEISELIGQRADIEQVKLITADEALQDFKNQSGFGKAISQIEINPLPHTIVITPSSNSTNTSIFLLHEEIRNLPETDLVQTDTDWVQRFHAILSIIEKGTMIGAALLGIAIFIIVGNTIRLDIGNRREEIEVTKLVGASNAFVRRPFLWTGLWYGFFGGTFSLFLVQYALYLLKEPITRLGSLYQEEIFVTSFSFAENSLIIGSSILLCFFTSWATTSRYMRQIEPR